jgi:cardiolipin synthase
MNFNTADNDQKIVLKKGLTLADKITSVRFLLIPVFVSLLFYFNNQRMYLRYVLLAVFGLAVLSDFFDGLAARIRREKSAIGQIIDPLADKLLLLTAFIAIYVLRHSLPLKFIMPLGVVLTVVSRDCVIVIGLLIIHLLKTNVIIVPSAWGKVTTFFQMAAILGIIIDFPFFPLLWIGAIIFTFISGIDYFIRGVRTLNVGNINNHN